MFPDCFDPYLRYAMDTPAGFRFFMTGDPAEHPMFLLVRLGALTAREFQARVLSMPDGEGVLIGPTEDGAPYVTLRIPAALMFRRDWLTLWDAEAAFVTASMPTCADLRGKSMDGLVYDPERPRSSKKTILGIIDDGCAFAHHRIRASNLSSRVFALWDQECRRRIEVGSGVFGRKPRDFRYGLEFWRAGGMSADAPPLQEIGIDQWITLHQTSAGTVDEDGCYAHAGFASLDRRASHGMHVLDVMAGRVPTSARVSMDRKNPPSFAPGSDPACDPDETDIVFVQIPQDGVNDASGVWLKSQVVDGLRYILSCAGADTERVIVNVSYGRTTGPHDGTAELEEFFAKLTNEYDGTAGRPLLDVVLPAGNSRRSDAHVEFRSTPAARRVQWTWRLPPDNSVPVMAEVWVATADAAHVSGELRAPSPQWVGQQPTIQVQQTAANTSWVITIPPTRADAPALQTTMPGNNPAPHGDWTITLEFDQDNVEVHAYAARTDPNMGARPGAKASRFVDPAWQRAHGAAAALNLAPPAAGAMPLVCPSGTLSGIATADKPGRIHVAAGYRVAGKRCSGYSSGGPSRGTRKGPDYALPTDETVALVGIPGAGTRSGGVFRLVGTSTASPQLARLLAGASAPNVCSPDKQDPDTGCMVLDPP